MLRTSTVLAYLVGCAIALVTIKADAGFLNSNPAAYNDGNGPFLGAWTGTSPFSSGALTGTVDWAVFTDTTFNTLFAGGGYVAPAGEFVYAHQIFSSGPPVGVSAMDIPLAGYPAGNAGSFSTVVPPVTGLPPSFAFADSTLAQFNFGNVELNALTPSAGLVYSSPNPPQLTGELTVIDGGTSAVGVSLIGIPGQIPEPTTLITLSIATAVLSTFRRPRRD
jgi:hypothetical protein